MEYSEAVLGNMNECAHFTVPNGTDKTRVSLDFRIVPWQCWETAMKECSSAPNGDADAAAVPPYQLGKYYSECRKAEDGSWFIVPETAGLRVQPAWLPPQEEMSPWLGHSIK